VARGADRGSGAGARSAGTCISSRLLRKFRPDDGSNGEGLELSLMAVKGVSRAESICYKTLRPLAKRNVV
jgi:hypothetical protein